MDYGTPLAPAGNVYTSLEDLAKFIALQFLNKRPAILNRQQLDELLIPPMPGNYAAGWSVALRGEETWISHGGEGGCVLRVVCGCPGKVPSRGRAYIAVANSWDDDTFDLLDSIISSHDRS